MSNGKKIVKNVIWSQYRKNWYMQCILFKSLSMFVKSVNNVAMSWMWRLCRDRPQSIINCKFTAVLISSIECMNTSEKLVFILSGLNCEYVSEWRDIYEEIVSFIFYMNHEFRKLAVTVNVCFSHHIK